VVEFRRAISPEVLPFLTLSVGHAAQPQLSAMDVMILSKPCAFAGVFGGL
jgi:hypothetical protein